MLRILQKPPPVGVMLWSIPCQMSWDDLRCNKNVCYATLTPLLCILKLCHKYCPLAISTKSQNTDLPLPWAYRSAQENSDEMTKCEWIPQPHRLSSHTVQHAGQVRRIDFILIKILYLYWVLFNLHYNCLICKELYDNTCTWTISPTVNEKTCQKEYMPFLEVEL